MGAMEVKQGCYRRCRCLRVFKIRMEEFKGRAGFKGFRVKSRFRV